MEGPMAEQKKKEARPTKPNEGGGDGAAANPELQKKGKKIKEDIDKLLDEIDDILEENAEEFFKRYVPAASTKGACPGCASGDITRKLSVFGMKTDGGFVASSMPSGGGCCGGGGRGCPIGRAHRRTPPQ